MEEFTISSPLCVAFPDRHRVRTYLLRECSVRQDHPLDQLLLVPLSAVFYLMQIILLKNHNK